MRMLSPRLVAPPVVFNLFSFIVGSCRKLKMTVVHHANRSSVPISQIVAGAVIESVTDCATEVQGQNPTRNLEEQVQLASVGDDQTRIEKEHTVSAVSGDVPSQPADEAILENPVTEVPSGDASVVEPEVFVGAQPAEVTSPKPATPVAADQYQCSPYQYGDATANNVVEEILGATSPIDSPAITTDAPAPTADISFEFPAIEEASSSGTPAGKLAAPTSATPMNSPLPAFALPTAQMMPATPVDVESMVCSPYISGTAPDMMAVSPMAFDFVATAVGTSGEVSAPDALEHSFEDPVAFEFATQATDIQEASAAEEVLVDSFSFCQDMATTASEVETGQSSPIFTKDILSTPSAATGCKSAALQPAAKTPLGSTKKPATILKPSPFKSGVATPKATPGAAKPSEPRVKFQTPVAASSGKAMQATPATGAASAKAPTSTKRVSIATPLHPKSASTASKPIVRTPYPKSADKQPAWDDATDADMDEAADMEVPVDVEAEQVLDEQASTVEQADGIDAAMALAAAMPSRRSTAHDDLPVPSDADAIVQPALEDQASMECEDVQMGGMTPVAVVQHAPVFSATPEFEALPKSSLKSKTPAPASSVKASQVWMP